MIPDWLIIGVSTWFGTTLYTKINIKKDHIICVTDISNLNKVDGHIITKYGNVFNHSNDSDEFNCKLVMQDNDLIKIIAARDIAHGEELLVNYNIIPKPLYYY